jgi:hypothetical protein
MGNDPITSDQVQALYQVWAPDDGPWSDWAKPVLFAALAGRALAAPEGPPPVGVPWAPSVGLRHAVVVDLPGGESVQVGLALAARGYQPVPLFNGTAGGNMIVDVSSILIGLLTGAQVLTGRALSPDSLPAFLLDADRQSGAGSVAPGRYDNRWCVLPQDFPSARRLRERDVHGVVVVAATVRPDLAHVLRRYEEDSLPLFQVDPAASGLTTALSVPRPSRFRGLWYRIGVVLGLRRNAAGGFGARVPEPGSGARGFG